MGKNTPIDESAVVYDIHVDWIGDKKIGLALEEAAGLKASESGSLRSDPPLHDMQFEVPGLDAAVSAYCVITAVLDRECSYGYTCLYEAGEDPVETTIGERSIGEFPASVKEFLKGSQERFFKALQKAA